MAPTREINGAIVQDKMIEITPPICRSDLESFYTENKILVEHFKKEPVLGLGFNE
jgi:hypothetical protein